MVKSWVRVLSLVVIGSFICACSSSSDAEKQAQLEKAKEERIKKLRAGMDADISKNFKWYNARYQQEEKLRKQAQSRLVWVQGLTDKGVIFNQTGEVTDIYCPVYLLFRTDSMLLRKNDAAAEIMKEMASLIRSYHIEDLDVTINQYDHVNEDQTPLNYQRALIVMEQLEAEGVQVRYTQATVQSIPMPVKSQSLVGEATNVYNPHLGSDGSEYIHIHFRFDRYDINRRNDGVG